MSFVIWIMFARCFICAEPTAISEETDGAMRAQWRRMFDSIANEYRLVRHSDKEELVIVDRAAYTWARSGPNGGSFGEVYVWTHRGNAESVACFWRYPRADGTPSIVHELHSLSPDTLDTKGNAVESWKPKAGLKRHPLTDAPIPLESAVGRIQQMRALCRDFSAHSISTEDERTELRLLPQPLYRYQSTNPDVLDGALFAFVCGVGTDPELFLQLEAIKTAEGPRWHYTAARFSHMNLFVNYKDKQVWSAIRDLDNPMGHNADYTYFVSHQAFDKTVLETFKNP